jgi:carboxypeptidase Taq
MEKLLQLKKISAELFDLGRIRELLAWDQEVYMPPGAAEGRGEQMATLSLIIHKKQTSSDLGELLQELAESSGSLSDEDKALVRVMKRGYDLSTKLPESFVSESTKAVSAAIPKWIEARKNKDFSIFQPHLEKIIALNKQQAGYLGYSDHPMDPLLDIYEEGLTVAEVTKVFDEIKEPLIDLLNQAKNIWNTTLEFSEPLVQEKQIEFSHEILKKIGYDFNRGRLDSTIHPFMIALGHDDRRVTSRYNPNQIEFVFSALHEGGHALYEQGISKELARTALDEGVSLGIHESQSRFWENIVGRSREFWENYYSELQNAFPSQFKSISLDDFYKRINEVKPGFIRVDADEVTYNLHILVRFEIEKALIEGTLDVKDAPEAWNAKYKEYLGLDIPNYALGILQDVHWAHGTVGYFATYTLGNLASAQIWNSYKKYDAHAAETIQTGNLDKIRSWLTENIYQHGSVYTPTELMKRVTGEPLQSKYLLEYLRGKYL